VTAGLALAFRAATLATLVGVPLYALRTRGRSYALFATVTLGLALPGALVTQARLAAWLPTPWPPLVDALFLWGSVATLVHFAHLVQARLRSRPYRALVSIPAQTYLAASLLAGVFQLALLPLRGAFWVADAAAAGDALRWLDPLPYALALLSIATSARPRREWVRVRLGKDGPAEIRRAPVERRRRPAPPLAGERVLRIVQITDPHLGPWQSVGRMQRRIEELVAHEPDLVLLTGDFLTMEGHGSPGALAAALEPLRRAAGRCYAIFGNHDHESPREVRSALAANGVRLLVDEEAVAATPAGPVQILGADWARRERRARLHALLDRHPRRSGCLRLLLLHDPSGFHDLPDGAADLVLSGHTHGGQVGLVSLGLDWTVLSRSRWPDHGLFARGASRLYVHRGTGFYGFPLRLGVPGEASVLEVVLP